ncbi:MAG: hypothetical protein BGN95_08315 [Sphingomonas sp. 66-10]|jgi:uncharacterized membrane protein YdjX (TVP38/TMEM64 family)|uniref:hypothetical protein n=1 Tax=Sphingomonas sp. 66-10 TaxID=1895848 RepID=UPI00092B6012|nr:hypothetical protein [Sphingomonas sp. 66-10]OJU23305.1 MAG: hypothetical protein BGN95_08315 [Sphingomonas sp. 66-10]
MIAAVLLFLIVFGINLLPAFGPPTWSIIVFYGLNSDVPTAAIVVISAAAAACGRLALAHGFRFLRGRLPKRLKDNLEGAREALEHRQRGVIVGLGLFALSPLPSAQLFEAAGLAGIRLLGFTAAFFAGRLISYSVYAASAKTLRGTSLGDAFANSLTSPWGIALQVGMILLLAGLTQINWRKFAPHDDASEREGKLP